MVRPDTAGWGTLRVSGRLEVVYSGEAEEPAYLTSDWFRERRVRPDAAQRSALRARRGRARIDPQGALEDPTDVSVTGYLAFERLADRVPAEYVPPHPARGADVGPAGRHQTATLER